jgi:hypothetical protein
MSISYIKFWQAVNLLRRVETRLERFKASGTKHFLQALTPLFVSPTNAHLNIGREVEDY